LRAGIGTAIFDKEIVAVILCQLYYLIVLQATSLAGKQQTVSTIITVKAVACAKPTKAGFVLRTTKHLMRCEASSIESSLLVIM